MIKLERPPAPQVLVDNGSLWRDSLLAAIASYGSYKLIPEEEKRRLLGGYHHDDIKVALTESSHGKCAFCECIPSEGGYVQVEHFSPKSLYPQKTFEWKNLLPACAQCNSLKSNHDTEAEPIVNPYEHVPTQYFDYDLLSIKPIAGPNFEIAKRTIEVCGLDSLRVWKPRAEILVELTGFRNSLQIGLAKFYSADTERKKAARIRSLKDAILTIETLIAANSKYSAFCADFLSKCTEYADVKKIISDEI
jgi:uncharacterized protein (TIGR02646 family)